MEEKQQRTDERRHGLAALFDEYELKDLFRKYVHLLLVVEGLIFLVCWVYQLGLDEAAVTGHPVDIPFPWKTYFVVALSAPVAVTFLVGIVVAGFNAFVYGHQGRPLARVKHEDGTESRLAAVINFCMQLPFLLILGMLGILIGVLYNLGSILEFLGRFGEAASRIILIGLGAVLAAGTIYAVVRLILQYKLRAKNMEYEYKRQVMEQLGIAIVDNTVVHKSGTILPSGPIDVTPQLPQGGSQPPGEGPRPGAGDAAP